VRTLTWATDVAMKGLTGKGVAKVTKEGEAVTVALVD